MSDLLKRLDNLSPEKRELVLKKLRSQKQVAKKAQSPAPTIVRVSRKQQMPLSFAQQRLWFMEQLAEEGTAYNMPASLRLSGSLNVNAFKQALAEIVRRHEILNVTFRRINGFPIQVIDSTAEVSVLEIDLQELPAQDQSVEVHRLANEEAQCPFDLSSGPLLRVKLLRIDPEEHILLLTMHHIISDEWSIVIFIKELAALYGAFCNRETPLLPELPIQYVDFACWQQQWLQGERLETQLNYWKKQLVGIPPVLELPTKRPRPLLQTFQGAVKEFELSRDLTDKLRTLSQQSETTLFMTLLAAFATLLYRYSTQEDIVVGSPIANRNRRELEPLIGFFVNTLVLRIALHGNPSFLELLTRVRQTCLEAYSHQDVPFEKIVEALHPERNLSHNPLFQVMFVLQNAPKKPELPGLKLSSLPENRTTTKFDLTLLMTETEQGLKVSWRYKTDLFDETTINRMAQHLQSLLEKIVANPQQRVCKLPILNSIEQHQLLIEWNNTKKKYPQKCAHQLFEDQVEKSPESIAVEFEGQKLTYRELNSRANQLAHHLQFLGVEQEVLVGIYAERSIERIVGMLGILKAGGAYVPLDPNYPQERLAFMLSDSRITVLLTQEKLLANLPSHEAHTVSLDADWQIISQENQENCLSNVKLDNLAYLIYTSGSTGKPKGVLVLHRGLCNLASAHIQTFDIKPESCILQFAAFSFDASVSEIFKALCSGARLCLGTAEPLLPGPELIELLRKKAVTHVTFPPSALVALPLKELSDLQAIVVAGEACSPALAKKWSKDRRFYNAYGPTEATVCATVAQCTGEEEKPPIGRPIANTTIYILDRYLRPVPIGVPGEIYIGGVGIARGYLDRPELTKEKFISDPFSPEPDARLYKTGDLARYQTDGNIEYIGRIDRQVKIRGFRIELGDIEVALAQHPQVRETAIIAREDRSGDKQLVAYIISYQDTLSSSDLRCFLQEKLPNYMIPSVFVQLEALPLTPNGKVDRLALPAPSASIRTLETSYVSPKNPVQKFLASLWKDILGLEKVGIYDNFFELGGNSIKGAILINKLQEQLEEFVYVVALFEAPTIAKLADYLRENYPRGIAKILGLEVTQKTTTQSQIDTDKVSQMRQLIFPLPKRNKAEETKNPQAIFILSPPRSGSTLLRVILGGHPLLFAPPELELLSFNTLEEREVALSGKYSFWLEGLIRAIMEIKNCSAEQAEHLMQNFAQQNLTTKHLYHRLQQWLGNKILVDKTPSYALDLEVLRSAEENFNNPLYIHLLRHPYGTIRSFEEAKLEQVFFRYEHSFSRRELAELIWLISHQNILKFLQQIPEHRQHRLKFEDLVQEPQNSIGSICQFLNLDFHSEMLEPYQNSKQRMTDGIHPLSKMLGDVKFHKHQGIQAETADSWKQYYMTDFLGDVTWQISENLDYQRILKNNRSQRSIISPILVPIQPSGSKPPVFFVHAADGNVLVYSEIASYFSSDRPIYGLQALGLNLQNNPHTRIEEMAAYYIRELQHIQPQGPYHLVGWSSGGVIVYEMAQQLLAQNQQVSFLGMLDTYAVNSQASQELSEAELLAGIFAEQLSISTEQIKQLQPEEQLNYVIKLAKQTDLIPLDFKLEQVRRLIQVFVINKKAAQSYIPQSYAGRVTIFQASEGGEPKFQKETLEILTDLAEQGVESYQIPGNHTTMLRQPHVQVLAERLLACLD